MLPAPREECHHHEWPHQVELFLDREAPEVAQRRERLEVRVALAGPQLVPVAAVGESGDDVAPGVAEWPSLEQRHVEGQHQQQYEECREQAPCPSHPERPEVDLPGAFVLGDDEQGDEIARDDEEHLDTEESTAQPGVIGVVHEHGHDRDRSQAVEAWKVGHATVALTAIDRTAERGRRSGCKRGHSVVKYRRQRSIFATARRWCRPACALWTTRRGG